MKKDELTALGLNDEQADKVLAINGRDIEKHKKAAEDAKSEVTTLTQQLADRDKDLETLKASAQDAEKLQADLTALQTKYTEETAAFQKQLADREYADALTAHFQAEKIVFTSKGAETAVRNEMMANRMTLKDGKLEGFADRIKAAKESDPGAFQGDKPAPTFAGPAGPAGAPSGLTAAAAAARAATARFAPAKSDT